ncbi:MAG TPA: hypothetical protein VHA33_16595 [Candidatus Angelobacter sp.]|nr:hypothetical protein [Candidatus Angelobacter sp.]
MQGATQTEEVYQPGDIAPESGVYAVVHDKHRERHLATIFKGMRFPHCGQCKERVRFTLSRPAAPISEDADFR